MKQCDGWVVTGFLLLALALLAASLGSVPAVRACAAASAAAFCLSGLRRR